MHKSKHAQIRKQVEWISCGTKKHNSARLFETSFKVYKNLTNVDRLLSELKKEVLIVKHSSDGTLITN